MYIKYNDNNLHALPNVKTKVVTLRNKSTGKKRQVVKLDTNQSPDDIAWLRPGWNEFPKHIWDQNKNNPGVIHMLETGKIELMAEKVEVKVGGKKVVKVVGQDDEEISLKVFAEAKAIQIVKGTYNRDILGRWIDEESRHKVKRALTKQLEPLLNKNAKESEDD